MTVRTQLAIAGLFGLALAAPPALPATPPREVVDLELVLATDNSQSIDPSEAALQRRGVAAAFRSPEVIRAIQSGSLGRIAVAYLDWSSLPYTRISVGWHVVSDKASADKFADDLLKAPPAFGAGTAIGEAVLLAARMIETNAYDGTQRTIDVSGDGPNNTGQAIYTARDDVVSRGITINGLPVVSTGDYGNGEWGIYYGDLEGYYTNCVIGGPRSFAIAAKGFQEFAAAIRHKLVLEISDAGPSASPLVKVAAAAPAAPVPARPPTGAGRGGADKCGYDGRRQRFRNF
jgi:hypothetical protein